MRLPLFLPATALLATLTGVALLCSALAVRPPGQPAEVDGPLESANRTVVLAFYDAVNTAIATGELDGLTHLIAPDVLADGASESVGLARRLLALHATSPALHLTVADLAVDGELAIARLAIHGAPTGAPFLGLDLVEHPAPWGAVDVLRMAAGRIVAHDSGGADLGLMEPVVTASFDGRPEARASVIAERVTVASGAHLAVQAGNSPRLVYVEAGTIAVEVTVTAPYAAPASTLVAGQHLTVRTGAGYILRNAAETPAVLLDLRVVWAVAPLPSASSAQTSNGGVPSQTLAGGQPIELPVGPLTLAVGRVTLAPGARLSWTATAGPVLLHIETGEARLDTDAAVALTLNGATHWASPLGDEVLIVGAGALVAAGHPVELRTASTEPLTALVIVWRPAG